MTRSEFLTPDQLLDRWGKAVGRGTLANWRAQKKGPPFTKVGARVVYRLVDVEAWEAANTAAGGSNDNARHKEAN